jgi:RNA polymerase sigma factor (TIGR02999 family)
MAYDSRETPDFAGAGQLPRSEVTRLLKESSSGGTPPTGELLPALYGELKNLAAAYMRRERPNHTLQATALVHEAYLRLVDASQVDWKDRAHFFAIAARLMRRILIEHARGHRALKRGGDALRVSLDADIASKAAGDVDVLAVDEILASLEKLSERRAKVVELRIFGGLTFEEVAETLDVSPKTVEADWYLARAWLRVELKKQGYDFHDA